MPSDSSLREYYRDLGDDALLRAQGEGEAAYDATAWRIINEELASRNLASREPLPPPWHSQPHKPAALAGLAPAELTQRLAVARRHRFRGLLFMLAGFAATFAISLVSAPSGSYVLFWGAILFGFVEIVRWHVVATDIRAALNAKAGMPAQPNEES